MVLFNLSLFTTYLQLGYTHIADLNAYDHIVFIIALCAIYRLAEWKRVLILVTAFTLGHSITLALAIFDLIRFPSAVIELLIPVTILLTCLYNVSDQSREKTNSIREVQLNYIFALLFGLIHGMGFSNFLRASLMPGEEQQLWQQLLAFNIGIELGQLLIVGFILAGSYIGLNILKIRQYSWNLFVSGAAFGIAFTLLLAQL